MKKRLICIFFFSSRYIPTSMNFIHCEQMKCEFESRMSQRTTVNSLIAKRNRLRTHSITLFCFVFLQLFKFLRLDLEREMTTCAMYKTSNSPGLSFAFLRLSCGKGDAPTAAIASKSPKTLQLLNMILDDRTKRRERKTLTLLVLWKHSERLTNGCIFADYFCCSRNFAE